MRPMRPQARGILCSKMAVYEAFNGDVISFATENATRNMDRHIALQVHHFSKSSGSFEKTLDKVLSLNISTFCELQVWRVKCSLDTRFGIYRPCILLRQASSKKDNMEKYHVFLLESYDSLIMIGSFEVNRTGKSQIEFHLIDGPAVCWAVEGCVVFARYDPKLEKMTVETINVIDSLNKPPVEEFNLFWCGLLRDETVAMGTKLHVTSDGENVLTRWTCISHPQNHIQEIPLIPKVYIPIVTFILIRDVPFGQSETMYDGLEVFLTTNHGQLLKFMDGHLKNCWPLPFNDACRIWILEPEPGEVMVMIASQKKKVCVMNCKKNQVVKEYDDIELVLVDDFLESGHEQVLFLQTNLHMRTESGELSRYLLIDMAKGMVSIDSEGSKGSASSQPQPVTDSLLKTAQALQTRLQARASALHEAKMECHEKWKMVERCCKVLKEVTSSDDPGSKVKKEKCPGLYCLLEGALTDGERDSSAAKMPRSTLSVNEIWQRVVHDQWIVGVDVENTSESSVSDFVVGLVSCQPDGLTYTSKASFCSGDTCHHKQPGTSADSEFHSKWRSPSSKRQKRDRETTAVNQEKLLPGDQTSLTVVASLPRFAHSDSSSVSVVVTWTSQNMDRSNDRHSMHCGDVTLHFEQIINGSLNVKSGVDLKSTQHNIEAFRSVSIETKLSLRSRFSSSYHIALLVKTLMRDVPVIQVTEGADYSIMFGQLLLALQDNGPLGGAGIVLSGEDRITLITRNKKQAYLLLHRLRQVLPPDVSILADPSLELSAVKNSVCTMNHEVTNLQQNLHKLIEKASGSRASSGKEGGQEHGNEGVGALRDGFERKRAREAMRGENISSEQSDILQMWSDFVECQISSDCAVAKS